MKRDGRAHKKIVDRALVLANQVGLEGLSLGVLASDLKRSKSGLFAHFKSKEELQLDVLREAIDRFVNTVIKPALEKPRGEQRLLALFDGYMGWVSGRQLKGGCIFMALSSEYGDRPGPVRDLLVESQRNWTKTIARVAQTAVEEKYLRADLDTVQFAYEVIGIGMAFKHAHKLMNDSHAERRARTAFENLLARSTRSALRRHREKASRELTRMRTN